MKKLKKIIKNVLWWLIRNFPPLSPMYYTQGTQTPITLRLWYCLKVLGFNHKVYWPVHHSSFVGNWKNSWAGVETCPGYMPGCY